MAAPLLPLALFALLRPAEGGMCWSSLSGGRCTESLGTRSSRAECCGAAPANAIAPAAAWSSEDLDAGALFFWRVLGGGVPCQACRESCVGVSCGAGRRCAVRGGRARCVCASSCARAGPACGSDGRTYRSLCRLRRRACRRRHSQRAPPLALAYYGRCQSGSCSRVRCPLDRQCVLDTDMRAHCVRCPTSTCDVEGGGGEVCAADGRTYASSCALRRTSCERGRAVPVAYKGKCFKGANCSVVRCRERQTCLSSESDGGGDEGGGGGAGARCVSCARRCTSAPRPSPAPLCATNNRTYGSWCHVQKDACATGVVIDVVHSGQCKRHDKVREPIFSFEDSEEKMELRYSGD